jgi:hypothetical protein
MLQSFALLFQTMTASLPSTLIFNEAQRASLKISYDGLLVVGHLF